MVAGKEAIDYSKCNPPLQGICLLCCSRSTSTSKDDNSDRFCIDSILCRHARKLLSLYRLRDLAFFAANMEDYQLVSWLRMERYASTLTCLVTGRVRTVYVSQAEIGAPFKCYVTLFLEIVYPHSVVTFYNGPYTFISLICADPSTASHLPLH